MLPNGGVAPLFFGVWGGVGTGVEATGAAWEGGEGAGVSWSLAGGVGARL
jgi:hypothetical protein